MRFLLVPALALLAAGCSSDPVKSPSCIGAHAKPAFVVTLQASDGEPLPSTTRVTVKSGSGVETFDASQPSAACSMMFCRVVSTEDAGTPDGGEAPSDAGCGRADVDAGAGTPTVASIICSLWTDGAADVKVEASGFLPADDSLKSKSDECGVVTVTTTVAVTRLQVDAGN